MYHDALQNNGIVCDIVPVEEEWNEGTWSYYQKARQFSSYHPVSWNCLHSQWFFVGR
jgi:hypothetical protein